MVIRRVMFAPSRARPRGASGSRGRARHEPRRERVPPERPHRIGELRREPVALLLAPGEERRERGEHGRAGVSHAVERPEAAAARHPRLDAARLAALARAGPEADEPLGEEAALRVERARRDPAQRRDLDPLGLRVPSGQVSHSAALGASTAPRGREVAARGAAPTAAAMTAGRRRAARDDVVHRHGLAERERAREEDREGEVVPRRRSPAGPGAPRPGSRPTAAAGRRRRGAAAARTGSRARPRRRGARRRRTPRRPRLPPEQLGPLVLLGEPHRAVQERDVDPAVGERLDVVPLEVERHRPEHDLDPLEQRGEPLAEIDDRLLAPAAGGVPVERDARASPPAGGRGAPRSRRAGAARAGSRPPPPRARGRGTRAAPSARRSSVISRTTSGEPLGLAAARPRDPEARRARCPPARARGRAPRGARRRGGSRRRSGSRRGGSPRRARRPRPRGTPAARRRARPGRCT